MYVIPGLTCSCNMSLMSDVKFNNFIDIEVMTEPNAALTTFPRAENKRLIQEATDTELTYSKI